jgi:hypothetical protein
LSLSSLTSVSAQAAKALAQHKGQKMSLPGLTTLDAGAATALAQHKGLDLFLNGLTTLSDEAAKALAQHQGGLSLGGLTTLSAEAAKALAQHKGRLYLDGLTTLSDEATQAIAECEGPLFLSERFRKDFVAKNPLSPKTARFYALMLHGNLNDLTALDSPDSVAIAKALAARKGRLLLPNLKKLSPKTLSALIEKEDIEIPLIESLELIPEPDGSPTEDFVIPERFQERQKR